MNESLAGRWVQVITATMVLVPYATVGLPFRRSLEAQAAGFAAGVLLLVALAVGRRDRWRAWRSASWPARAGLLLYGALGVYGAAIGVLSGNEPRRIAGQLVAMALLSGAGLAGCLLASPATWSGYVRGIVAGGVLAGLVQLLWWSRFVVRGSLELRLQMPNQVSLAGLSLLCLVLALWAGLADPVHLRRRYLVAAGLMAVTIVGSGTRSLWLASAPTLTLFFLLARPFHRRRFALWIAGSLTVALAIAGGAAVSLSAWLEARPNQIEADGLTGMTSVGGRHVEVVDVDQGSGGLPAVAWECDAAEMAYTMAPVAAAASGMYRLSFRIFSTSSEASPVYLNWLDTQGTPIASWETIVGEVPGWQRVELMNPKPLGGTQAQLVLGCRDLKATDDSRDGMGRWVLAEPSLSLVSERRLAGSLIKGMRYLEERVVSTVAFVRHPRTARETIGWRYRETAAVLEARARSSSAARWIGQGLGATYPFEFLGPGATSSVWVIDEAPNFIHNFYIFLLYKLGNVGAALAMVVLALWLAALLPRPRFGATLRSHPSGAAFATLTGYLIWSVASPQILDFRAAPFLGLLIGLASGALDSSTQRRAANSS